MLDLNKFKCILLSLKADIDKPKDLDFLKSEKAADEVDTAINDNAASLASKFLTRNVSYLKRIDQALRKVEDGTYGECENCGDMISEKRLLVRPVALLCIDCKIEEEKEDKREKDKLKGGILFDWD